VKVTPQARAQVLKAMTEALVKTGVDPADAAAAAEVMVEQAITGLAAGKKPEDPGFITDEQAGQMADRLARRTAAKNPHKNGK
jgi:hypothetical protein